MEIVLKTSKKSVIKEKIMCNKKTNLILAVNNHLFSEIKKDRV